MKQEFLWPQSSGCRFKWKTFTIQHNTICLTLYCTAQHLTSQLYTSLHSLPFHCTVGHYTTQLNTAILHISTLYDIVQNSTLDSTAELNASLHFTSLHPLMCTVSIAPVIDVCTLHYILHTYTPLCYAQCIRGCTPKSSLISTLPQRFYPCSPLCTLHYRLCKLGLLYLWDHTPPVLFDLHTDLQIVHIQSFVTSPMPHGLFT